MTDGEASWVEDALKYDSSEETGPQDPATTSSSSELSEPVVPEPPTVNEQDSALTHTADTERSDDTEPDDEAAQKEAAALLAAQHAAAQAIEEALAAERQHEVRGNEDLDVTVRVRHDDSPAVPEDHSTETKPEPPAAKPKPKAEETDEADNVDKADTQDDDSGTKNDSAESDDDTATHEKHTDSGSKTTKNNDQDDSPATETIEPVAPAPPRTPSAEVDSDTPGNSDENPEQPDSPDVDTGTAETDADAGGNADLDTEHSTDETTEAGGSGEGGGHDGNDHGGDHGEGTGDGESDSDGEGESGDEGNDKNIGEHIKDAVSAVTSFIAEKAKQKWHNWEDKAERHYKNRVKEEILEEFELEMLQQIAQEEQAVHIDAIKKGIKAKIDSVALDLSDKYHRRVDTAKRNYQETKEHPIRYPLSRYRNSYYHQKKVASHQARKENRAERRRAFRQAPFRDKRRARSDVKLNQKIQSGKIRANRVGSSSTGNRRPRR